MNIKEEIVKLVDLQKIDRELFLLRRELGEDKPAQLAELDRSFADKRKALTEAEEELKAAQLRKKDAELNVKSKEEAVAKANTDLFKLKTNEDYRAKLKEIETLKLAVSAGEEDVLLAMEQIDMANSRVATAREAFKVEEAGFDKEKKALEAGCRDIENRVRELEAQREIVKKTVDPQPLAIYERMVDKKEGLAIVPLDNDACGGCFMNQPPDTRNKVLAYREFIYCSNCARLLFIPEDLEK
jgi:predicted  nucleic acid-binding Zn-ribbon protein